MSRHRSIALAATTAALVALALLAGCGGGSATASHHAPPPEEFSAEGFIEESQAPNSILGAELVRGEEGWAHTYEGLFWTADGGQTWRPITPPLPDRGGMGGIYFADPRRGWVMSGEGREGDVRVFVYRTTDGGRSWHRSRLRGYNGIIQTRSASFSLVGRDELFALVRFSGDTASNAGELFVSHDGGTHWHVLPQPPQAGRISFEASRRGWLASEYPGPRLWRTVDGGRSWTSVEPGRPPRPATHSPEPPPEPGAKEELPEEEIVTLGHGVNSSYTTPVIGADGHGVLGFVRAPEAHPHVEALVFATADGGRTWQRSARIGLPRFGGDEVGQVFFRRGRSRSLLVLDPSTDAIDVVSAGGRARPLGQSRGLPDRADKLTFSDRRHGLSWSTFGEPPVAASTKDGGRDWERVPLPGPPAP
jgi:photosystem II stability/assembly factor-like uncharacterized protein